MTKRNYINNVPRSANQMRKPMSHEKKIMLATTIKRLKEIEDTELADFVGFTRNALNFHYKKIYGTSKGKEVKK